MHLAQACPKMGFLLKKSHIAHTSTPAKEDNGNYREDKKGGNIPQTGYEQIKP
jgi:hypothetical protein